MTGYFLRICREAVLVELAVLLRRDYRHLIVQAAVLIDRDAALAVRQRVAVQL